MFKPLGINAGMPNDEINQTNQPEDRAYALLIVVVLVVGCYYLINSIIELLRPGS